jgi:apolipoprotein N-acyltransferase
MILRLWIALLGGILMGITPAPVGAWPLAWIALAPLWVQLIKAESKRENLTGLSWSQPDKTLKKEAKPSNFKFKFLMLNALAWGIGYHGLALSWVLGLHPLTWMGIPWVLSLAIALTALILFTIWGATLVVTWTIATKTLFNLIQNPLIRILIGTALWCSLESIWSAGPLWWTSLSYTQSPHNLAILHLGQISGPNTITAAIVAVNGLLAQAWINRPKQTTPPNSSSASSVPLWFVFHKGYLASSAALLITLHLIGFSLYNQPLNNQPNTALKIGIIQGNVPNRIKFTREGFRRSLISYTNGYITLAQQRVQAVLTPEGALSSIWTDPPTTNDPLYQAILEKRIVAWIGAHRRRENSFTNSLFTVTGSGEIFSRYDKINLVPFGEYIPFEQLLGGFINSISAIGTSQISGISNQLFDTPFSRAIVGICFDSAFSRHFQRQAAAGGEFIITASNNDPYSAAMQFQHHAQDTMRAIETNRWAARATNTGYSGIVDPHGRTLWISGHNTYEVRAATIYRRQTQTLYVRWGDWLTLVLLGLGAVSISWELGKFKSCANRPTRPEINFRANSSSRLKPTQCHQTSPF